MFDVVNPIIADHLAMILAYFSTIFLVILGMVYCSFYHIARVRDSFGFFNEARTTDHKRRT